MTFLNWGGNNERNVESLIMILFYISLASLSPPHTGSPTKMLKVLKRRPAVTFLEQVALQCDYQCSL